MRRITALLLCATLPMTTGCALHQSPRVQTQSPPLSSQAHGQTAAQSAPDGTVLVEYARQLKYGTRVQAMTANNRRVRGTLIKTSDQGIVILPHGRLPEPMVEIAFRDLRSIEPERPSSGTGKAIAIGAVTGAGAAFGVLMLLVALYSD